MTADTLRTRLGLAEGTPIAVFPFASVSGEEELDRLCLALGELPDPERLTESQGDAVRRAREHLRALSPIVRRLIAERDEAREDSAAQRNRTEALVLALGEAVEVTEYRSNLSGDDRETVRRWRAVLAGETVAGVARG